MPRKSKNAKMAHSNMRAMRTVLRSIDANLGTLANKTDRLEWLKPIATSEKFPYTGSKDIGPFHNEETLHEAITYAVRDAKKYEYKELKGPPAMNEFFKVGSAMLNSEYLVSIGYMFLDHSGVLRLRDEADARNDDPLPSMRGTRGAASFGSSKQIVSGPRANDRSRASVSTVDCLSSVESTHKEYDSDRTWNSEDRANGVETEPNSQHFPLGIPAQQLQNEGQAHKVFYEPVPTSTGNKKRKFVEPLDNSDPPPPPEKKMDDDELWQHLCQIKQIIAELSTTLCTTTTTTTQPFQLRRLPSTRLANLYAQIFHPSNWRTSFDNLVKNSTIQPSSFLQAIFWSLLTLHIFPTTLYVTGVAQIGTAFDFGAAMASALANFIEQQQQQEQLPHNHPTTTTTTTALLLQQFQEESNFMATALQPFATILARDLQMLVGEHISTTTTTAADADGVPIASISNPAPTMLTDPASSSSALEDLCEKALLFRARMDVSKRGYRLLQHLSGSEIYVPLGLRGSSRNVSSSSSKKKKKKKKEAGGERGRVAFTVAPGLERKVATLGGGDADAYVVVGPALVAEARK
ncbi:hypothetical protein BST61_g4096 [Cercospora zeina]